MSKTHPPEQDVDQLLGAFFKSEIPDPWPAFEPPARTLPFRPAPERRGFVLGSRLALAASVALLLVSGWLLSGSFNAPNARTGPGYVPEKPEAQRDKGKHKDMPPMDFNQESPK